MHSVSPYLFRSFNNNIQGTLAQKYSVLENVNGRDLYEMLKNFINDNTGAYKLLEDTKQVYQFDQVTCNDATREISGWFNVGHYGIKTDIINIDTGLVDFEKAQNNAEIIKHYVHFFIPRGFNEGMAFLHSYRGIGVKTLFYTLFAREFVNQTRLVLQMNPLAYDNAINAWLDATAKEVRLTKFVGVDDLADQIEKLGHSEQELVIKPPRRNGLGKLRDYINQNSERRQAIEVLSEFGGQIKTVVEMNNKQKTFCIGRNTSSALCEIELSEDVTLIDGVPELNSFRDWVREIVNEYAVVMYPGLDIGVA